MIGDWAFDGCTGLTSIKIPNSVIVIGDVAFRDCTGLTSVKIPNSVIEIGHFAFWKCSGLTSIEIPNSVTEIEQEAFLGCKGLTSINIPNSVIVIGKEAFEYCSSLTSIIIPNSVIEIGDSAFVGCKSLTSIEIPNSVTEIGRATFAHCSGLASITIPKSVTEIGPLAFVGCTSLASITIPDSVTTVGWGVFENCTSLTSIEIPNSVTKISWNAFIGCKDLAEIIVPLGQKARFNLMMIGLEHMIIERNYEKLDFAKTYENSKGVPQEQSHPYYLFFDTETTGTPRYYSAPVSDSSNWPRLVQIGWIVTNQDGEIIKRRNYIIRPEGFTIPIEASNVHHITTEKALQLGTELKPVLQEFYQDVVEAEHLVGHNIDFDQHIVGAELYRNNMNSSALMNKRCTCTMHSSTNFCAIPNPNGYADYKWPKLQELYYKLFGRNFEEAHDAMADITATKECFFELKRRGII